MGRCPAGHPLSGAASELRRNTRASGETEGGNQAQAAASAGAAHQPPSEQRAMEMVACGKRGIQKQASSSSHDSLEISQTARDSPIPTAPTTDSRMREAKTTIGNCLGRGKLEIQKRDSHFLTAPTACGSQEETIYRTKTGTVSDGPKTGTLLSR